MAAEPVVVDAHHHLWRLDRSHRPQRRSDLQEADVDEPTDAAYFPTCSINRYGKFGAMVSSAQEDRLDETFAALANPTRRAILARLAQGEAGVNELAEPFALTLPAISKHIKVLERAGLVVRSRRAQSRPCALDPAPLAEVSSWAEQYRPVWEARFDRLDHYLQQLRPQPQTGEGDG